MEVSEVVEVVIENRFQGPPMMGHGGYVAGLLAAQSAGDVQVTLRRPIPLDVPLQLDPAGDGRFQLRNGEEVLVESEPSQLDLEVPPPPSFDAAQEAESRSPSFYNGTGVHPTCFGCGAAREDGLRVFVGPLTGGEQVAGTWDAAPFASPDGTVGRQWVLAALDCPGAFAFISAEIRAGLLGRIVFAQHEEVRASNDLVVSGWQVGSDGRKLFAGTALSDGDGRVLAAAKATWFPWPGS